MPTWDLGWHGLKINSIIFLGRMVSNLLLVWSPSLTHVMQEAEILSSALEVEHGIVKGIRMQLVNSVPTLTPRTGLGWGRDRQRYKDISAVSSGCQLPAAH